MENQKKQNINEGLGGKNIDPKTNSPESMLIEEIEIIKTEDFKKYLITQLIFSNINSFLNYD